MRRRSAASASRACVSSFSLTSNCSRAASHSWGETIGGVSMGFPSGLCSSVGGGGAIVLDASQHLLARGSGRMRGSPCEDRLDPVVQRVVVVERGGTVQQADPTDRAPEHQIIVRRGGQGADERE